MTASSEPELALTVGTQWFRMRAAAVIIRQGAALAMGNPSSPHAYAIGGAIKQGETAEECLRREVQEELGVDLEVERLLFGLQSFVADGSAPCRNGLECHEVAFSYLMRDDPRIAYPSRPGPAPPTARRPRCGCGSTGSLRSRPTRGSLPPSSVHCRTTRS